MSTYSAQLEHFLTSDATFRTWASGIAAAIQALGFTKTGDTGQINLATATWPAGVGTYAGYEVYAFTDSLQGTLPIYFKIEYGVGAATSVGGLRITVATQTNGAGTLSGQSTGAISFTNLASLAAANVRQVYAAGAASSGRIGVVTTDFTALSRSIGFFIERTLDVNGNPTADGFVLWRVDGSAGGTSAKVVAASGAVSTQTAPPLTGAASVSANNLGAYQGKVFLLVPNPILGKPLYGSVVIGYVAGTLGAGPFTARVAAADHIYLALGALFASGFNADSVTTSPGTALAMRYD